YEWGAGSASFRPLPFQGPRIVPSGTNFRGCIVSHGTWRGTAPSVARPVARTRLCFGGIALNRFGGGGDHRRLLGGQRDRAAAAGAPATRAARAGGGAHPADAATCGSGLVRHRLRISGLAARGHRLSRFGGLVLEPAASGGRGRDAAVARRQGNAQLFRGAGDADGAGARLRATRRRGYLGS